MQLKSFGFILVWALGLNSWAANKGTLQVIVPSTLPPPLLVSDDDQPAKGIVPDYLQLIAKELDRELSIVFLPKNRIDEYMSSSGYDINCYTNPTWVPHQEKFFWSIPLFSKKEVILGKKPMPKNLSGFEGKTIGTVLGYRYPKLDPYFENKKMIREDAPDEEANIKKFLKGRIGFLVMDEIYLNQAAKTHTGLLQNTEIFIEQEYPIQCSLNKKSSVSLQKLNKAIETIKSSGVLDNIFKKY
jgi:polar amino acid transport system substrate-binding protein